MLIGHAHWIGINEAISIKPYYDCVDLNYIVHIVNFRCAIAVNTTDAEAPEAAPRDTLRDALRDEVTVLLEATGAIDETCAKRLRKQWQALRDAAQNQTQRPPQDERETEALFAALRTRIHAQVALREEQYAALEAQVQQLQASVQGGDVAQAQPLEQALIHALNQIAGLSDQRRQKIITAVEQLRPQLQSLTEWRHWGHGQARTQLIEEIRGLHVSGLGMSKIAQRIQLARQQWKDWAQTGDGGTHKLYAAFDQACVAAYLPCQQHFDQQKQQRQLGSEAREKICTTLEQAFEGIDSNNPDWKKMQHLLRAQADGWRRVRAADYRQRKPLQRRFDEIFAKFDDKLERERQRNYRRREKLIEEITQLAQRDDVAAALAELPALKQQWAPTAASSRRRENAIWKRFTAACDALFEKRDQQRQAFKQTLRHNLAAKNALCAQIEKSCQAATQAATQATAQATASSDDGAAQANPVPLSATQVAKWGRQWDETGAAPKTAADKVNQRYRRAMAGAQQAVAQQKHAQQSQQLDLLLKKSQLCADFEALALGAAPNPSKLAATAKQWQALPPLADELDGALQRRWQATATALDDQAAARKLRALLAANGEALQALVLQLEIIAEVDSPAAFSQQRMAMRIAHLSAALGKGEGARKDASAEQIVRNMLVLGAVEKKQRQAALKRLARCRQALGW